MEQTIPTSRLAPARSCLACRRRKIKCNRTIPCSYCAKLRVQCIYPDPGPGQEGKTQPESDVLSRLKRIEMALLRLQSGRTTANTTASQPGSTPSTTVPQHIDALPQDTGAASQHNEATADLDTEVASSSNGKLILSEGDTRYVTGSFWVDLNEDDNEEVPEVNPSTGEMSSMPSHPTTEPMQHQNAFVFGFSSASSDLRQLHPPESRVFVLWQIFLESVDPLLKIIHVHIAQRQILRASQNLDDVPPAFEALMFSIYYAAVTSIQCAVSCQTLLKEERQILLDRYRFGVEQAMAKANLLGKPDVPALQALTLYLICARHSTNKTYIWTMTGLAIRLATKLGLHRDPALLGLPPFVAEMRRRLWWQICILDVRTAEENDMDPMLCEHNFNTKFPSNVNDSDLDVNMTQTPGESPNRTDMLFTLTRLKISYEARKIVFSPKFTADNGYPALTSLEKSQMIESVQREIEEKFLKDCDTTVSICFLAATSTRIVLSKMKLTIHHPARSGSSKLSHGLLVDLVGTAIEIIEYAHTLRTSDKYSKWVWLFQKYIEWDAVAFLLHSLIAAPLPGFTDKIWAVVDVFFQDWNGQLIDGERRWGRLESLKSKAEVTRPSQNACGEDTPSTDSDPAQHSSESIGGHDRSRLTHLVTYSNQIDSNDQYPPLLGNTEELPEWSFNNMPYVMQGAPSWEMDIDENAFNSWL